ncbi:MAG: Uncharacterised protein [Crocinitomicaceae bacterium]|nr:MAG: Uncharacterised protein [Crocinitomicaceae bacterium]
MISPAIIKLKLPKLFCPINNITIPKTTRPAKLFNTPFVFLLSLSVFIRTANKTGVITRATNNDEPKTIIKVIGRYCINSPIIPGQSANGTKAASVVAVEAIIGQATSPIPFLVASNEFNPSSISLYTFSTTTIPLSTNIPRAKTKEKSTIIFKLTPAEFNKIKDKNIENGIAIPTKRAFLRPKKNSNTNTTKITPKTIEFSKLLT